MGVGVDADGEDLGFDQDGEVDVVGIEELLLHHRRQGAGGLAVRALRIDAADAGGVREPGAAGEDEALGAEVGRETGDDFVRVERDAVDVAIDEGEGIHRVVLVRDSAGVGMGQ
jgi:hypothetical protein